MPLSTSDEDAEVLYNVGATMLTSWHECHSPQTLLTTQSVFKLIWSSRPPCPPCIRKWGTRIATFNIPHLIPNRGEAQLTKQV